MKRFLLGSMMICILLASGCGDDSTESVIIGTWFGTTIFRDQCDDVANDGGVNCPNNVDNCVSCIELKLNRGGTYSLTTNFDASPDSEAGSYEAKNDVITLDPSSGDAYDLPISNVDETNMVIKLPRSGGCVATITMKSAEC